MADLTKLNTRFHNVSNFQMIVGSNDKNIKVLNSIFNVNIFTNGEDIFIDTFDTKILELIEKVFEALIKITSNNIALDMITNLAKKPDVKRIKDRQLSSAPAPSRRVSSPA